MRGCLQPGGLAEGSRRWSGATPPVICRTRPHPGRGARPGRNRRSGIPPGCRSPPCRDRGYRRAPRSSTPGYLLETLRVSMPCHGFYNATSSLTREAWGIRTFPNSSQGPSIWWIRPDFVDRLEACPAWGFRRFGLLFLPRRSGSGRGAITDSTRATSRRGISPTASGGCGCGGRRVCGSLRSGSGRDEWRIRVFRGRSCRSSPA